VYDFTKKGRFRFFKGKKLLDEQSCSRSSTIVDLEREVNWSKFDNSNAFSIGKVTHFPALSEEEAHAFKRRMMLRFIPSGKLSVSMDSTKTRRLAKAASYSRLRTAVVGHLLYVKVFCYRASSPGDLMDLKCVLALDLTEQQIVQARCPCRAGM